MINTKTNDEFIDSGATHNFFQSRSSLLSYETNQTDAFQPASTSSSFIGKGNVLLPIDGGIIQEVYHAVDFTSNVLASHLLSESYEIAFFVKT